MDNMINNMEKVYKGEIVDNNMINNKGDNS